VHQVRAMKRVATLSTSGLRLVAMLGGYGGDEFNEVNAVIKDQLEMRCTVPA
jgi:hypothetical protein